MIKDKIVLSPLGKSIYKGSNKANMDKQLIKMNELNKEKPFLSFSDIIMRVVGSANECYFKRIEEEGGLKNE